MIYGDFNYSQSFAFWDLGPHFHLTLLGWFFSSFFISFCFQFQGPQFVIEFGLLIDFELDQGLQSLFEAFWVFSSLSFSLLVLFDPHPSSAFYLFWFSFSFCLGRRSFTTHPYPNLHHRGWYSYPYLYRRYLRENSCHHLKSQDLEFPDKLLGCLQSHPEWCFRQHPFPLHHPRKSHKSDFQCRLFNLLRHLKMSHSHPWFD